MRLSITAGLTVLAVLFGTAPAVAAGPDTAPVVRPAINNRLKQLGPASTDRKVDLGAGDCVTVQAKLRAQAAQGRSAGGKQVNCVTAGQEATKQAATAGVKPRMDVGIASWCDARESDVWWYHRDGACVHGIITVTTLHSNGTILGSAYFQVTQEIIVQPAQLTFTESVVLSWLSIVGPVATAREVSFTGGCFAPCSTIDGTGYVGPITVGQSRNGFMAYGMSPGTSQPLFSTTGYSFVSAAPPAVPSPPITLTGPPPIRCDNQLPGSGPGCVIPSFTPWWEMPIAAYGAAAFAIYVAQEYLPDGWGFYRTISRTHPANRQGNYDAICGDGTFIPTTSVEKDSCDEFSFASTNESGNRLGVRGRDCAEIVPYVAGGRWVYQAFKMNGTERCMRAHVNADLNSLVGSHLQAYSFLPNRVLVNDQFLVIPY